MSLLELPHRLAAIKVEIERTATGGPSTADFESLTYRVDHLAEQLQKLAEVTHDLATGILDECSKRSIWLL